MSERWTPTELQLLRHCYGAKTLATLRALLNRSTAAIRHKVYELGLHNGPNHKWTPLALKTLAGMYKNLTRAELAKEFDTTEAVIKSVLYRYGIKKRKPK